MHHTDQSDDQYLSPTPVVDSDSEIVMQFASDAIRGESDPAEKAQRLFYAVRDEITYDIRCPFQTREDYRASAVLERRRGLCISKAVLLCAVGRASGIPARLGFANIRNRGASPDLIQIIGSDYFAYHGFTEFHLQGSWIKLTPAFHSDIYERHNIDPVTFDGRHDAVFPSQDRAGNPYVEYLVYHPSRADLPLEEILSEWIAVYGVSRMKSWIRGFL